MSSNLSELRRIIDHAVAELRPVLAWIERHPVLVASFAVLLPSAGIYYYAVQQQLPLSLLSSDAVSALPMLLAVTVLRILALSVLFFSPIALSPHRFSYAPGKGIKLLPEGKQERKRMLRRWSLALIVPGALHFSGIYVASHHEKVSDIALWASVIGCLAVFVILSRWAKPSETKHKWVSMDTYFLLAIGFVQLLAINTIMRLTLGLADDESDLLIGLALLSSALFLGLLQSLIILVIDEFSEKYGVGVLGFSIAAMLIICGMLFPLTGGYLTSQVVNPPSRGNSSGCMTLELNSRDGISAKLLAGSSTLTHEVKQVYSTSAVLLLRKVGDETRSVYRLPAEKVAEFIPCPRKEEQKPGSKS